ncbi:MAG: hypothetical protein R3A10_17545 [Caldilineaceae bacterium]
MPEMDGLTLALELRRSRSAAELPLVVLTSLGRQEADDARAASGDRRVLTKPLKPSQLYNELMGIFGGQSIRAGPSRGRVRVRPGHGAPLPHAHPGGRGQPHQSTAGRVDPGPAGLPARCGEQQARGRGSGGHGDLRHHSHGHPDAGQDGSEATARSAGAGPTGSGRASSP